jgi:hypothetical protein
MRFGLFGAAILAALALNNAEARGAETDASDDAACASIGRAVHAVSEAERFHSRLEARSPGRRRPMQEERFVLGDVIYTNSPSAGRWVKLPLTPEDRRGLEAGLVAHPPNACRDEGRQELAGVPVRVYAYRQQMTDQAGGGIADGRLWVAEVDGRPRRYEGQYGNVTVTVVFDYENVTPPYGSQQQ